MVRKHAVPMAPAAQAIRAHVLESLARHRNGDLHFPWCFVGLEWGKISSDNVSMAIADGPHCHDTQGCVDIAALAILADTALATTARPSIAPLSRLATLRMDMRFTGVAARGRISAQARLLGFSGGTAIRQALSAAELCADGAVVAHASGEFAVLDPPPGVELVPLPWESGVPSNVQPIDERELDARERSILKACDSALAAASPHAAFLRHFWGGIPKCNSRGAGMRVAIKPHLGNRVGHVQGGILFGMAAASACAAAPATMMLSSASAWFIGPGHGTALRVDSGVVHAGRTICVVRTQIRTSGGARVLEVVTHHVARVRASRN